MFFKENTSPVFFKLGDKVEVISGHWKGHTATYDGIKEAQGTRFAKITVKGHKTNVFMWRITQIGGQNTNPNIAFKNRRSGNG